MSNEDQQNQSTEFESEMISEEPPSFEEKLDVLDKVFDKNVDAIDAAVLLADAEIDLSTFLLRVQYQMKQHPKTIESRLVVVTPLERLDEAELDILSDEEVLSYLQAEGIDCGLFIDKACRRIASRKGLVV